MTSRAHREPPAALLRALLGDDDAAAGRVLHPEVVLTRADGVRVRGAAAVTEGVRGGSYAVVRAAEDALTVALSIPGLPTPLLFTMRGAATAGRLTSIEVTLTAAR